MKEEIINKLLEELKNNIPEDYVRSYDTSDGVGYYELDEDSWQYQVYHYIENLQSQLKAKEEELKYNVPIVEHNKIVSEKNKQIKHLQEVIKEAREVIKQMINTGYFDGEFGYFATSNKSEFGVRAKIIDEILSKGENK